MPRGVRASNNLGLETEMTELIQHGEHIHQVYRDVDLLSKGLGGAWSLQNVTAYVDEYLKQGWRIERIVEAGIRDVGDGPRDPKPVLGLLYILVK